MYIYTYIIMILCGFTHIAYHVAVALFVGYVLFAFIWKLWQYSLFICTGHLSVYTYIMTLCGFMHMAYHVAVALFV